MVRGVRLVRVQECACCCTRGSVGVLGVICSGRLWRVLLLRLSRLVDVECCFFGEVDALVSHVQTTAIAATLCELFHFVCDMIIVGRFSVLFLCDAGDELSCGDCGDFFLCVLVSTL